jgi:hypothetical protein
VSLPFAESRVSDNFGQTRPEIAAGHSVLDGSSTFIPSHFAGALDVVPAFSNTLFEGLALTERASGRASGACPDRVVDRAVDDFFDQVDVGVLTFEWVGCAHGVTSPVTSTVTSAVGSVTGVSSGASVVVDAGEVGVRSGVESDCDGDCRVSVVSRTGVLPGPDPGSPEAVDGWFEDGVAVALGDC